MAHLFENQWKMSTWRLRNLRNTYFVLVSPKLRLQQILMILIHKPSHFFRNCLIAWHSSSSVRQNLHLGHWQHAEGREMVGKSAVVHTPVELLVKTVRETYVERNNNDIGSPPPPPPHPQHTISSSHHPPHLNFDNMYSNWLYLLWIIHCTLHLGYFSIASPELKYAVAPL